MSQPRIKREQSPEEAARTEDALQYGSEVDASFPNRPRNHGVTLLFSELFRSLFNPLSEIKAQPAARGGPARAARARAGFGPGSARLSPHEQRRGVILRFITRWRTDVGDDFYPALRLILPDKDRDRSVYGLKEHTIGRLLVKLMKIDKNSDDGHALLHWKLPGGPAAATAAGRSAGDFAARCHDVLAKRPLRTAAGDLRIGQVNVLLDRLAATSGEAEQLPLFETFYEHMNPEELTWLIRIVLRQMKVGASERTILSLWHPDGEALFSVSSSLRRVCWELVDPQVRLVPDGGDGGGGGSGGGSGGPTVALMQCFQPQLAQFQMPASFQKMVDKLGPTADDAEFWIEEKLDGERMQMHMVEDAGVPGGHRFGFWSRRAKDYTDLYGDGLLNAGSALTQHLQGAFAPGVRNLILDGEMITWDPALDKMVAFGTLKTAALGAQANPHDRGAPRPLFRVFDLLYLNDQPLTRYTLRDRRRALERAVAGVPRRLEVHPYEAATSADAIEPMLRRIVAEASEGLVLKNPRSMYRLNSRNDDWIKVKPEYMTEFGESLDCVVVGGYFGSGRRGGTLSSFLCGLRVGRNQIDAGARPEKCLSFFKVGGGFRAEDYAEIRHATEGKWVDWDSAHPPSDYVELAGGERGQIERPDVWIRPRDSVVLSVKASSIAPSDSFAVRETLRFPRFRRLRLDRAWDSALGVDEFQALRDRIRAGEHEHERKAMQIEDHRQQRRRPAKKAKLDLVIAGQARGGEPAAPAALVAPATAEAASPPAPVFAGLDVCVLSEAVQPVKTSKAALEALVKAHGGRVAQRPDAAAVAAAHMVVVADKRVVKVASLIKAGAVDSIVRPSWLLDCVAQTGGAFRLPLEPRHLLHASEAAAAAAARNTDAFDDSFARDVAPDELRAILDAMAARDGGRPDGTDAVFGPDGFLDQLEEHGHDLGLSLKSLLFRRCRVFFAATGATAATAAGLPDLRRLRNCVRFGRGAVEEDDPGAATHVVVVVVEEEEDRGGGDGAAAAAAAVRQRLSRQTKQPRVVRAAWLEASWKAGTLVDEELYAP